MRIRSPDLDGDRWYLPRSCLTRLVIAAVDRYGHVVVARDMAKLSRCTRSCLDATGMDCDCACMGLSHGSATTDNWVCTVGDVVFSNCGEFTRTAVVFGPQGSDHDAVVYAGELAGYPYRADRAGRRSEDWPLASDFVCAGCMSVRASVWDHCHTHGYVRAPLCGRCNTRHWRGVAARVRFRGHTGWVYACALTTDGQVLASAGDDGQIRLWCPDSGEPIGLLPGHRRRVRSIAFTGDGRFLLSCGEDGNLHVWDVARRSRSHSMYTCGTPLWALSCNADNSIVAAAGEDEYVRLYDLASGELLDEKAVHRDWIRTVAFAAHSTLLASGSGDHSVIVWDTTDRLLTPVRTHELPARVRSVIFVPRTGLLCTATEDAVLRAFDARGLAGHSAAPDGVDWIRALAITGEGNVVAGCEDGGLRIWTATESGKLQTLSDGANTIWSAYLTADSSAAIVGYGDGRIELLDGDSAASRRVLDAHAGRVWSLACGGNHVAAACGDGSIRLWSLDDENLEPLQLSSDATRTWAVALSRSGDRLAASSGDGSIRCWALPSAQLLWQQHAHAGRVRTLAFNDNADLMAACGGDGTVLIWDVDTGQRRSSFSNPGGWARSVALDSSGTRVAVGSGSGDIYIRSIADNHFHAHLPGHSGRVLMLTFGQGPDRVLSAAADGTIRAWSITHAQSLAEVRVDATLNCAAAAPDTGHIVVASASGPVSVRLHSPTMIETSTPQADTARPTNEEP